MKKGTNQFVHPASPEVRQCCGGCDDTAEHREHDQQERVEQGSDGDRRTESSDCLTQSDGVNLDEEDHDEEVPGSLRGSVEADSVVEKQEEGDGTSQTVC